MSNANVEWFQKRLVPFAAGLLDESEEARFRSLMNDDAACAELYALFGEGGLEQKDDAYHLPPDMIARWEVAKQELQGFEREMVVKHLERCDDCRADIELLGFSPLLDAQAAPEQQAAPDGGLMDKLRRFFTVPVRLGATAAAAAAIAIFALLPRGGPMMSLVESLPVGTVSLDISATTRSFDTPTIEVDAGTSRIGATLPALNIDPATVVEAILLTPDGEEIQLGQLTAAEFSRRQLSIGDGKAAVEPGNYRLEIYDTGPPRRMIRDIPFNIEHR